MSLLDLLFFFVIAGLDPAIHKEISNVPIVRWILGSQPENDRYEKNFY
ncbi:MAG: hypothetical protein IJ479_05705 [Alphaproteobacteria bacterium]|nr:hypothetical protein [Alphaproteobacteria bacterium]